MTDVTEPNKNFDKLTVQDDAKSPMHGELLESWSKCPTQAKCSIAGMPSELTFSNPYKIPNTTPENANVHESHHNPAEIASHHAGDAGRAGRYEAAQPHHVHAGHNDASQPHPSQRHPDDSMPQAPTGWKPDISRMRREWNRVIRLPNGEIAHIK
jgi:hypothetical protein